MDQIKIFKRCLSQILFGLLLNILTHLEHRQTSKIDFLSKIAAKAIILL